MIQIQTRPTNKPAKVLFVSGLGFCLSLWKTGPVWMCSEFTHIAFIKLFTGCNWSVKQSLRNVFHHAAGPAVTCGAQDFPTSTVFSMLLTIYLQYKSTEPHYAPLHITWSANPSYIISLACVLSTQALCTLLQNIPPITNDINSELFTWFLYLLPSAVGFDERCLNCSVFLSLKNMIGLFCQKEMHHIQQMVQSSYGDGQLKKMKNKNKKWRGKHVFLSLRSVRYQIDLIWGWSDLLHIQTC